jgi:hypothetical protein
MIVAQGTLRANAGNAHYSGSSEKTNLPNEYSRLVAKMVVFVRGPLHVSFQNASYFDTQNHCSSSAVVSRRLR